MSVFDMHKHPVHLGLGATAVPLEEHDGTMEWYMRYGERFPNDGKEGRLVAIHTFDSDWPTWEVHPNGSELLYVISGTITLIQDIDGKHQEIKLSTGQAAINPPGVWHTAKVDEKVTVLFITAGEGTQNEVRD